MSQSELDPFQTPDIFSPLESPSLKNSKIDQEMLTRSVIEHKKIVQALERAILETNQELILDLDDYNTEISPVANDSKLLEFLKENREIIEPIIKEQYVESDKEYIAVESNVKIEPIIKEQHVELQPHPEPLDNKQDTVETLEKLDDKNDKQSSRLFIIGSVIATGVLGFLTYSYLKKKE